MRSSLGDYPSDWDGSSKWPILRCYRDEARGPRGTIVMIGAGANGNAATVTFVPVKDGGRMPEMMELSQTQAQILMDSLWDCGIRPAEGAGSAGSLRMMERHLFDMRAIVARQMGVEFK